MARLNERSTMPFGIYAGQELKNVPEQYLRWLWETKYHKFAVPGSSDLAKWLKGRFDVLKDETG